MGIDFQTPEVYYTLLLLLLLIINNFFRNTFWEKMRPRSDTTCSIQRLSKQVFLKIINHLFFLFVVFIFYFFYFFPFLISFSLLPFLFSSFLFLFSFFIYYYFFSTQQIIRLRAKRQSRIDHSRWRSSFR